MKIVVYIFCVFLVACSSQVDTIKSSAKQWTGPFGTEMGLTYTQLLPYSSLKPLDQDKQNFLAEDVPNNYGIKFNRIIYTINNVEGLCAVSLMDETAEHTQRLKEIFTTAYGKPSIDKSNQLTTWDKPEQPVITIRYNQHSNIIRVFYANYDRCHLN